MDGGTTDGRGPVRRWLPLRLAVVAVVALAGLVVALLVRQEDPDLVLNSYRGAPAGAEATEGMEPGWVLGQDGRLAVYAAGSSSCPWTPTSVTAEGDLVSVRLEVDDGMCTADMVYTTHVVALPAGVDPQSLEVELELVAPG